MKRAPSAGPAAPPVAKTNPEGARDGSPAGSTAAAGADPGAFSAPMNFPGLLGVYLAVNAISDAYILVDGPDCTLYKAHFIHGRHDWNSTLLRLDGRHRVAFTNICSKGVVKEHDAVILEGLRRLGAIEDCGLILATALPMCSITGVDYGRVIRGLEAGFPKPVLDIPPDSLSGDWLDGYALALGALAKGLRLSPDRKRPGCAVVVGHLMDRNESDHRANLTQLREMLGALSLDLASVWLDGESASRLRAAEEAELVISLPYGRAAARRIAEATGARLVETVLPFGLPRTIRFMREVGAAAGKAPEAEAWTQRELSRVVPRLKWIIPHLFVNKKTAFIGDPYLLDGFLDIAEELGMEVEGAIVRGRAAHGGGMAEGGNPRPGVLHEPPVFSEPARRLLQAPVDLLVSSWFEREERNPAAHAVLEFGFPSYRHHALYERPFLGFGGFLAFVERMADQLSRPLRRGGEGR